MAENQLTIPVRIAGKNAELIIKGDNTELNSVNKIDLPTALENGEAQYQIKEGCFYEFKITEGYNLEKSEIVKPSELTKSTGRISPNIFVGTLEVKIFDSNGNEGIIKLEVLSVKTDYRSEYKFMLEEITVICTELLFLHSSPVSQNFDIDFKSDAKILYQRFAFIKSILDSEEFYDSVNKILSAPVSKWKESEIEKDIRGIKRVNNNILRQFTRSRNRVELDTDYPLKKYFSSLPHKIKTYYKSETVDTPENRFIKHALNSFIALVGEFRINLKESRFKIEVNHLENKLDQILSHSFFKEVSSLSALPLNSPVLQRKEGYREILRIYLMLDLAAKLTWKGGEDVYNGNKRDVAVLYEYWLFFKLLEIIKKVFKIEPKELDELIENTSGNLEFKLKQGEYLPITGIYNSGTRQLNIEFGYNNTFSGGKEYPVSGSWTKSMRPDYTLCIWPYGINKDEAEKEELIVYIHFDAKYKVENLTEILGSDQDLNEEKEEQRNGKYRRADLLKMHAYKDAIRRTSGAYVIYPGKEIDTPYKRRGFHELIPGLGAFAIRPSRINNGSEVLENFLKEVIEHFLNRTSQREKTAYRIYDIHKEPQKSDDKLSDVLLPETYKANRNLIPDNTYVLIAYYKNKKHRDWISKNHLYNARTGKANGSIRISQKEAGAKYILLHNSKSLTGDLFKLNESGPFISSKNELKKLNYPNPKHEYYLVYQIIGDPEKEFNGMEWNIKEFPDYSVKKTSVFSVSLTDLMRKLKIKTFN